MQISNWQNDMNELIHAVAAQRLLDDQNQPPIVPLEILEEERQIEDRLFIQSVIRLEARDTMAWDAQVQTIASSMAADGFQSADIDDFVEKVRHHHGMMYTLVLDLEELQRDAARYRLTAQSTRREAQYLEEAGESTQCAEAIF
jgi:hypothetical protein